jgi:hypothetical protein
MERGGRERERKGERDGERERERDGEGVGIVGVLISLFLLQKDTSELYILCLIGSELAGLGTAVAKKSILFP